MGYNFGLCYIYPGSLIPLCHWLYQNFVLLSTRFAMFLLCQAPLSYLLLSTYALYALNAQSRIPLTYIILAFQFPVPLASIIRIFTERQWFLLFIGSVYAYDITTCTCIGLSPHIILLFLPACDGNPVADAPHSYARASM